MADGVEFSLPLAEQVDSVFTETIIPDWVPEGYRDVVLCPTTDRVCPARLHTVGMYVEGPTTAGQEIALDEAGFNSASDRIKLFLKAGEWRTQETLARNRNICTGDVDGVCPVRERMDNNPRRNRVVTVIRRILHGDGE
jgi:hypothetical protein